MRSLKFNFKDLNVLYSISKNINFLVWFFGLSLTSYGNLCHFLLLKKYFYGFFLNVSFFKQCFFSFYKGFKVFFKVKGFNFKVSLKKKKLLLKLTFKKLLLFKLPSKIFVAVNQKQKGVVFFSFFWKCLFSFLELIKRYKTFSKSLYKGIYFFKRNFINFFR